MKKIDINGTMEITTRIGCKIRCKYCPQDNLINAYKKRSDLYQMSFDTFKKCIDKIPKNIRIDFSGMAEPWLNPDCTKMLLYAHKQGFKIAVYTTLVGMTANDIKLIQSIPFVVFMIHLPDAERNTKIEMNNTYLEILKRIDASDICNLTYSSIGNPLSRIREIVSQKIRGTLVHSRAGNIKNNNIASAKRRKGKIKCMSCHTLLNHNVLLPSGDVLLCCMDYSMKHILGNLIADDYASLFNSKEFHKIQRGLNDASADILCRYCINAR